MQQKASQNPASLRTKQWREQNRDRYNASERERYRNNATVRTQAKKDSKKWYENNKDQARANVRQYRRDKRAFLAEVVGPACVDCGDDRSGAVEYHHPDGKKRGQVPLTHLSWEALKEEAMNLIALCGACHGVRHHKEV